MRQEREIPSNPTSGGFPASDTSPEAQRLQLALWRAMSPLAFPACDTSPEAQRLQVALWRAMTPLEKAQTVGRVSRRVRELSLTGIRLRHPSASESECHLRYALLTLGRPLACLAYPEAETIPER
jgi:hypothetical protein